MLPSGYTLGSLFTGIGGIDLAFVRVGFSVSFQVEIDGYCRKVLAKHAPEYWPNVQVFEDVKHVGSANLPNVDVLSAGVPCQPASNAGKRRGASDERWLWRETIRVIEEIQPRVVLLENVPGLRTLIGGDSLREIVGLLAEIGFDAMWAHIRASNVGSPQHRERIFIVAYSQRIRQQTNIEGELFRQSPSSPRWLGQSDRSYSNSGRDRGGLYQSSLGRMSDGLSRQLDTGRWPARPYQQQHSWELERQQPANSPSWARRIHALGNAVVPQVVQPIAEAIRAYLEEVDQATSAPTGNAPETAVAGVIEAAQS
jgi:DNA (cytosine-5)-methyltransferase 1